MWVCNGDQNTSFFHNSVRIRKHFNIISRIMALDGTVVCDRIGIEQTFLNFYSCLWSNPSIDSFNDVLNALPDDLPKLN